MNSPVPQAELDVSLQEETPITRGLLPVDGFGQKEVPMTSSSKVGVRQGQDTHSIFRGRRSGLSVGPTCAAESGANSWTVGSAGGKRKHFAFKSLHL